ncbi:MAG: hypothetical protein SCK28_12995 [Bacillota bacterium]|nr:hypothetical protein [Bacillota bacterium]
MKTSIQKKFVFLLLLSIFLTSCSSIPRKSLPDTTAAQLTQELNITLNQFFTEINLSESNDLNKIVAEQELEEEIKNGLAQKPNLININNDKLNFSIQLKNVTKDEVTALVSGKLNGTILEFKAHEFIFINQEDQWLIKSF